MAELRGELRPVTFEGTPSAGLQSQALLYIPGEHRPDQTTPLLVFLHGASSRGSDPAVLKRYGPLAAVERRGEFPFAVLAPQCSPGHLWNDARAIVDFTDQIERHWGTDPRRVYLTGLSMGGGGTWYVASQFPRRYAAIVPMCGPTQPRQWARSLVDVPVWCFHGSRDEQIPLARSREMIAELQRLGGSPRFTVLKGKRHDITYLYYEDRIYDWMGGHRLPPEPAAQNGRRGE